MFIWAAKGPLIPLLQQKNNSSFFEFFLHGFLLGVQMVFKVFFFLFYLVLAFAYGSSSSCMLGFFIISPFIVFVLRSYHHAPLSSWSHNEDDLVKCMIFIGMAYALNRTSVLGIKIGKQVTYWNRVAVMQAGSGCFILVTIFPSLLSFLVTYLQLTCSVAFNSGFGNCQLPDLAYKCISLLYG